MSAGNSYTANSTATTTAVNGYTGISGGCYATLALRNANNKIDPCLNWNTDMHDKVDTLGLTATRKNLLSGKLDISASVSYTHATTDIGVNGGNYAASVLNAAGMTAIGAAGVGAYFVPATALPTVKSDTTELRINGRYALSKDSAVRVGYIWQHMSTNDFAYDGYQLGGLSGALPTFQQSPNYTINTIAVTYIMTFR